MLVCFSPEIRNQILITNPNDRQYFTKEQCELVSGFPNKETDQDTFEQLMSLERKEIEYWLSVDKEPPFIKENEKYLDALSKLTKEEIIEFEENAEIPNSLLKIVQLHNDMHFRFIKLPNMTPSTGGYIFDDILNINNSESEYEEYISNNF